MAGTREGGEAAAKKNKARDPDHYKKIGAMAHESWVRNGRKPRGFALYDALKHKEVSVRGGTNGKRGKWSPDEYKSRAKAYAEKHKEES